MRKRVNGAAIGVKAVGFGLGVPNRAFLCPSERRRHGHFNRVSQVMARQSRAPGRLQWHADQM